MRKIRATIIKEWLLLKRDVTGFLLLFIMPALLIVIMALVQDAPFRDYQDMQFDLLMADEDGGSLAKEIKAGLAKSGNFHVIDRIDGRPVTAARLKTLLDRGTYQIGIVIPKGATAEAVNASNIIVNTIAEKMGAGKLPVREIRDSIYIRLYYDPVSKPAFRTATSFALDKYITFSSSNMLLQRLAKLGNSTVDTTQAAYFRKVFEGIGLKQEVLNNKVQNRAHLNSVQHNVPAWAIFGMFFIIVPIAGNMIKERDEGSATRVAIIPFAFRYVAFGKIMFYSMICAVQFGVMVCVGVWLMPLMDLPSLYLGAHPLLLIPAVLLIAFAATAFGHFIGTVFKTSNQALPFGGISVVILSALGGIWIPVDVLPTILQRVAMISPLHWGLDAIQDITLRNGNGQGLILPLTILFVFGSVMWLMSIAISKRKHLA